MTKPTISNGQSEKIKRLGGGPELPVQVWKFYQRQKQQLAKIEGVPCSWSRFFTRLAHREPNFIAIILNNGHGHHHDPPPSGSSDPD